MKTGVAYKEKITPYEEGGAHLKMYFSHLLLNLKNNCSLKKFLKWANEKHKNSNVNKVAFFKKKFKKNTWRYHYFTPVYQ